MNRSMEVSQKGRDLIKKYEGFKERPYECPGGKTTIGYGHVLNKDAKHTRISSDTANKLLSYDLFKISAYIKSAVRVDLSQGEFDALASLIYNWGCGNFGKSKGFAALNKGDYKTAAHEFFSKENGVVNVKGVFYEGLYNRRQEELELFKTWND